MYKKDWIMRQIENLIEILSRVFLEKETPEYELEETTSSKEYNDLYILLDQMLQEGKINEAENLLFDHIEIGNKKYLEVAINFYYKLNNMEDTFLEEHDFSRQEVDDGLKDLMNQMGIKIEIS